MTREELSHKTKDEIIDIYLNQMDEYGRRIAALTQTIADLKETLEEFKRMIFASKSEKKRAGYEDPNQLSLSDLFNEAEWEADPTVKEPEEKEAVEGYFRNKTGRKKSKATHEELYDQLPVTKRYLLRNPIHVSDPVEGSRLLGRLDRAVRLANIDRPGYRFGEGTWR